MAPPEKKQKIVEEENEKTETKEDDEQAPEATEVKESQKVAEVAEELEEDAPPIKGAQNKEKVTFLPGDLTLNALPSVGNGLLMTMSQTSMSQFVAGARGNVGVSKGRYLFEARVVETVGKPLLKVGFSTAGSSLVLGSTSDSIGFDSDGGILREGRRTQSSHRLGHGTSSGVLGVLLNLDASCKNHNTISLFRDGKRVTQPQTLPESLQGKVLFPHVSFRMATVFANFGPEPLAPLPFKCHMIQSAAAADCKVTKDASDDGKYKVVYPVSLPDQGTFDWLEQFKEKNPQYTELSDRAILDWAEKSGIVKARGNSRSNDKPDLPGLDDRSIRQAVYSVAPLQPRNYIVMEVKGNLIEDERKQLLDKFTSSSFQKVAMVLLGEPSPEFKKKTAELLLKNKQAKSDREFRAQKLAEKQKKAMEKKKKEAEKAKKKALKEIEKRKKEAQKKALAAKKAKESKDGEEKEEEAEEVEEEPEAEESEAEEEEAPEVDEEPPKVELTTEEKKTFFFSHPVKDLTPGVLSSSFAKFSIPTASEGFDEIEHVWDKANKCGDILKSYIQDKKLNLRVEDFRAGPWSLKVIEDFGKAVKSWQLRVKEFKEQAAAKARAKAAKAQKKAKEVALKEAKEKEAKKDENKEEEAKEEEAKDEGAAESEAEEEPIDFAKIDIYGAADVMDVGSGMPLFKDFTDLDWAMLTLRFELHILAHGFPKDVNDPERLGIHVDHLPFYYNRYFRKNLNPSDYGVQSTTDIVKLVGESLYLTEQNVLQSLLPAEMETFAVFAKITEDCRRHRQLRIALGEESAQLKLSSGVLSGAQRGGHGHWQPHGKGGQSGGVAPWLQRKGGGGKGAMKGAMKGAAKGAAKGGVQASGQAKPGAAVPSAQGGQWQPHGKAGQSGGLTPLLQRKGALVKGSAKGAAKGAVKGAAKGGVQAAQTKPSGSAVSSAQGSGQWQAHGKGSQSGSVATMIQRKDGAGKGAAKGAPKGAPKGATKGGAQGAWTAAVQRPAGKATASGLVKWQKPGVPVKWQQQPSAPKAGMLVRKPMLKQEGAKALRSMRQT